MGSALRVQLVDDSDGVRELVRMVLEREGAQIVGEAEDGEAAIALARETQPDLIILDIEMPGMSGAEALPALRKAAQHARIVILSHLSQGQMGPLTRARGAVGYVEKSTEIHDLFHEILLAAGLLDVLDNEIRQAGGFARSVTAPKDARAFIDQALDRWHCNEVLEKARLLVSEIVTNAVEYSQSDIHVEVQLQQDAIRVDVIDRSEMTVSFPKELPAPDSTTGRGLMIVATMADRYGVRELWPGKSVWFELART